MSEGRVCPTFQPPPLPSGPSSRSPGESGSRARGLWELSPCFGPPPSFTLSLLDEAARVPVTLRASFADRTLAWVSPWGQKKLILAPFLFYPQRFFEVGQSQAFPSGTRRVGVLGEPPCRGSQPSRNPGLTNRGGSWHQLY